MSDRVIFQKMCIYNIMNGVGEGLSKFSHPSKVALVYAATADDPVQVYDPHNILRDHSSKLKETFIDQESSWRDAIAGKISQQAGDGMVPDMDMALSGLISFGGCSRDFFYQLWLTSHHPDMCSIHPTEKWLEQAANLLAHDYNSVSAPVNSSDYVMKNYALQAISDFIYQERKKFLSFDSKIHIPSILNDILNISKTREEGAWARGMLLFTDPQRLEEIPFITKIHKNERPVLTNVKHIRKLLVAVENSDRKLVADGCTIIGITDCEIPECAIAAEFRGDHGFLTLGREKISSFYDGSFHSTTREAKLVELEELLLDSTLGPGKVYFAVSAGGQSRSRRR